ncbi:MAG: alpha/beta hydrolase, partial [Chthoniobacterales bacterium]
LMNRWINHYGKLEYREMDPMRFVRIAFASPAYSLADLVRLGFGYRFSIKHLWRDAFWIDFFKEIPRLEVPVYFFLGRHDRTSTASAELAALYFDALDAPRGKQLVWFENSGHWPHLNEPEKYRKVLLETVLAQTGATKKTSHE